MRKVTKESTLIGVMMIFKWNLKRKEVNTEIRI